MISWISSFKLQVWWKYDGKMEHELSICISSIESKGSFDEALGCIYSLQVVLLNMVDLLS